MDIYSYWRVFRTLCICGVHPSSLAGASPTKRKLHTKDAALTVPNLDLNDYAAFQAAFQSAFTRPTSPNLNRNAPG